MTEPILATGFSEQMLEDQQAAFEERKRLRGKMVNRGITYGMGTGFVVGASMDACCAVAPIINLPCPHALAAAGIGVASGLCVGYGAYKTVKPDSAEQMMNRHIVVRQPQGRQRSGIPLGEPVPLATPVNPDERFIPTYTAILSPPARQEFDTRTYMNPIFGDRQTTQEIMTTQTPFGGNLNLETGEEFKKGGFVKRTGLAKVHRGEYVVPKSKIKKCNVCK